MIIMYSNEEEKKTLLVNDRFSSIVSSILS